MTPGIILFSLFDKVSFNTLSCRRLSWTLCLPRPLDLLIPGTGLLISFPWKDVLAALLSWRLKCVRHQVFYSFPYCCFSKSPQRGGSEEQKCVLLYLWSPKCGPSLTGLSRGGGVALSLRRGVCFPASSNFWWLRAFLLCGHSAPILHPSSHDHLISSLVCSQIALGLPIL